LDRLAVLGVARRPPKSAGACPWEPGCDLTSGLRGARTDRIHGGQDPIVSSNESDKEIDQVNRQSSQAARLIAGAALLGLLVVGCARHGGGAETPAPSTAGTPRATATEPAPAATPDNVATALATGAVAPGVAAADPTRAAAPATSAPATPDPLDAELQGINQLLNGMDSSLSNSDSSGGE
jgi:hypothetical protein